MGTHPIFESDFDCLTDETREKDANMVLECVRIKNVPGSIRQRDIENEWGDLNIAHHGLVFLADRIYAFFEAKRDAEDAVARGFAHKSKTFKTKQISIDECIIEMRPLVADEKRRAHKLGEEYEYPVIFELNKIRIKWEQSVQPVLSTTRTVVLEQQKPQKDDAPYSDDGRKDKKKKSKKTKKKERSRSYDRSESRDNHDSRRTRTNRDSPPRHRSRTPPRKERNRERSEEQVSRRRRTRSRERQSDNRRGDRSRSRDYERGKRNRSRDSRRNTPPDMRQATNGDYNPLALLGSSLRKDGPDDKRDSRSKRSRFDSPPKSTPSSGGGGGGVDLRARLSRTNHRAEEKAKRVERAKDSINQYQ